MPKTVILGAARTPFGKMGGALASLDATDLGGTAIAAALERADVAPDAVQQVVFGQVLQAGQGQIPSRQAQIKGGIPKEVPSETVNKVCASGLRSAGIVDQALKPLVGQALALEEADDPGVGCGVLGGAAAGRHTDQAHEPAILAGSTRLGRVRLDLPTSARR